MDDRSIIDEYSFIVAIVSVFQAIASKINLLKNIKRMHIYLN